MIAFVALTAAIVLAGEQKVYKCQGADGIVVFSPVACGSDAQEMHVQVTKKANGQADAEGKSPTATQAPAQPDAIQGISDSVADSNCRRAAQRLTIFPDTSEIESLQRQVTSLESSYYVSTRTGLPNANSQMIQQEDRVRAATLRNTIAIKEQQNSSVRAESERATREALAKCDEQKAAREQRQPVSQ